MRPFVLHIINILRAITAECVDVEYIYGKLLLLIEWEEGDYSDDLSTYAGGTSLSADLILCRCQTCTEGAHLT